MIQVTCHMSHVKWYMSHNTCTMPHVTFHLSLMPTATDLPLLNTPLSTADWFQIQKNPTFLGGGLRLPQTCSSQKSPKKESFMLETVLKHDIWNNKKKIILKTNK